MRKGIGSWVVVALALAAAAGCSGTPSSCEEAACDPETEICRLFGSDTLEPSTASCAEIPAPCADDLSCDCLLAQEGEGSIATCEESGGVFRVIYPGG